ncbi:cutinase-domain-containing protein [Aspergillus cavernicola]|uniref:Cutinase-domain-containing protein n=1 Tax=Aspergillus cavernicola TaxID=176166 RepID=A0ABR4HVJ8_9EURO
MHGILITVGLLAAATAATNLTCTDGLYMIVARGTEETAAARNGFYPANSGSPGYVAQLIAAQIKDSIIMGVDYPATITDPSYVQSEEEGITTMLQLVNQYHSSCPNAKMALLGYSQGAQVVSDVLCGGSGGNFGHNAPLSPDIVKNNILAAVLFGDPTHIANTSYDLGTSVHNGMFPRTNNTVCKQYSDRMASWCDKGDEVCDTGHNDAVHGLYIQRYNSTMVEYVVERWQNSTDPSSTTTGSSTASPTSSETGSASTHTGTASGLAPLAWPLILLSCGLFFV